ncbi:APC family permease [Antarcticimicrobium sediminis]|uniref:Amino acid permease n=1 Tax=Antarcticimicrobium sediminis TaxID=2546227 RepID=A0A4R5F0R2_9RHOB|nr:APC family permease [Antarcticimicrobium sediminis]TDE41075.1 amino acid permease [Antarcticimicrobium sediminis]
MSEAHLKRRIGTGLLTAYGVGVMVGAGIYVLTGVAAGVAGVWAPLSFLLAGLVAVPSALAFAELSARIPEAAGDSSYIEVGLRQHWLAVLIGWINIVAGTLAAAAVLRGGVGYLTAIVDIPFVWGVIGLGAAMTLVALLGVLESLAFAAVLTVVEVLGLLLVAGAGFNAEPVADWIAPPAPVWSGVAAATVFGFFAFIGFDDMVNMVEETKQPERAMPRAILWALALTAILYALVSLAAVRAVPSDVLGASERPLALVWEVGTGTSALFLSAIAVAAALNGVLAQIVMAARVLFGLGKRSPGLSVFRHAHKRFGTPVLGTIVVGAATTASALTLPVATLAGITTQALLIVFAIVNAALIGVKRRDPTGPFVVPVYVPWLGMAACLAAFVASFLGAGG